MFDVFDLARFNQENFFMRILFLFLLIAPLIELYFLIQLGEVIGALPTVLLTIFTALLGVALMRAQGLAIMQKAQLAMHEGRVPQTEVMEGVFIFLGGIFLFFPGLISDGIGFLFLIPLVRHFLIAQSLKGMTIRMHRGSHSSGGSFYEGEWCEKRENNPQVLPSDMVEGDKENSKHTSR